MASNSNYGRQAASIAAATAGGLLVWTLAVPLADVDLIVGSGATSRQIGPGAVAGTALIAGLAAAGLAAVLARTVSRPRRTWLIVATAVLVLSLTGPLGAASTGAGLVLVTLHLVVAAILIRGIGGTLSPRLERIPDQTLEGHHSR